MKRSTDRILITHDGSLPRPGPLLDRMRDGQRGEELVFGPLRVAHRAALPKKQVRPATLPGRSCFNAIYWGDRPDDRGSLSQ